MSDTHEELRARICALEAENARLRRGVFSPAGGPTVRVPEAFAAPFRVAEKTVGEYFGEIAADPSEGTIEIAGERYLLVRASALSYGFLNSIRRLYADRGDDEALHIGKNLLFDFAHVIGINDARNFHKKMGVTDPVAKLSAGPVHFAYTGWAFVDILPESSPSPDDDFLLTYRHPFSFESDSWMRAGKTTDFSVCIMNAGYSSGWCEASFDLPLTAVEISCKAKGDSDCTFVMAPPGRLRERVEQILAGSPAEARSKAIYDIPTFFKRKQVEEQLRDALVRAEAANKAKSLFLANMSHEIRTPLNGVLGIASLLQRQELGDDQRKLVETIDESGKALLTILNDILDLSKIEAGMLAMSVSPCDVRAVLREVASVLFARVEEKGLEFSVEIDEALPPLLGGDCLRLRQVVLNLAGNAVKFTDQGGVILRASWDADPATLRVEVQDTGVGIAVGDVARLFEIFTQADSSSSRAHGGTGLGLSISRQLVQLMGGEIDVESEVGVGSTFWFAVPATPLEGTPPVQEALGRQQAKTFNGARVLVVEDNRINRLVAERLFAARGCRVSTVNDGEQAIQALAAEEFDLVFMDCQMPVMDGFEATRRIRDQEAGGLRTPIVAMTASVMQGDSERCFAAGMDGFLGKPIDPTQIQAVLGRWLPSDSATSVRESTES